MAMQTKKNSSRRHDARISRSAIRRMKRHRGASTGSVHRPPVAQHQPRVGQRRQLGVVRHQHQRGAARAPHVQQQLHDVPPGRRNRGCRSARRPARSAGRWRARAQSRCAAARRPTAATDSGARDRSGPPRRAAAARAPSRRGGRRSPSAPGCSRTPSATARGGRTGTRSRSSRPRSLASASSPRRGDVDAVDEDLTRWSARRGRRAARAASTCRCPTGRRSATNSPEAIE